MSVATLVALLLVVGALITVLPRPSAKRSIFGYKVMCPFSPVSTLTLLMAAGVVWLIGNTG
jgi:hypothetical protein